MTGVARMLRVLSATRALLEARSADEHQILAFQAIGAGELARLPGVGPTWSATVRRSIW